MADILGFKIILEGKEAILNSYKEIEDAHKKELKALKEIKDTSSDTYKTQQNIVAKLANEKQRLADELKKEQKELKSVEDQFKKNIGAYALMSKEFNTNRNRLKDLAAEGKEATDEFQDLEKKVLALDSRLKDIDFNVGQYQRNVGNYKSALQDYFGTGGIPAISEVASQFQGVGIAASLATGGAAAAAAALVEVANYVNETTKEFVSLRGAINDAFSGTDEQIDEYTVKTKALLDTFQDVDQENLINATASLTNITGDYSKSLALIGDGLLVNKGRQQEFIDQVNEYSSKLKDAGVTGEQSLLLISDALKSGTFTDTGIDAFNEGIISLRERTPATVKAIEGIGISSKQLDDLISEKGLAKTLEIVAQKTKGFGRESKEMGAILADVFRGAGEVAGFDFLQGINLAEGGLKELIDTSDQATINMQELLNANTELATSQSELAKEFGVTSGNLEVLKVEAENFFLRLLVDAIKGIKEFLSPFQDLGKSFNALLSDLGIANTDFNIFNSVLKIGLIPLQKISDGIQTFVKGISIAVDKVRDFAHWTGVLNKTEKENAKVANEKTTAQNNSTKATKDKTNATKEEVKTTASSNDAIRSNTKARTERTKAIADEKKEAALATTSLAYMKKELATLKQELETAPNQTAIESTILKINEAEAKIKAANDAIELFKRKLSEQEEGFNGDGGELQSVGTVTEIQDDAKIEISQKTQDVITEMTKSAVDERTAYEIEQQKEIAAAKEDIAAKSFEAARGLSEAITAVQLRNAGDNEAKIKEIKEKAAKREKAIAITETLFNTYKAATAALATPPPFGQILAGVVTAIGLANVAKIAATPIQLAKGGIIGGSYLDSYSNDTQPALLSRGEAVIPASSVSTNPAIVKSLIANDSNASNALLEPVRDEMYALLVATNNRIDRITVISDPLAQINASLAQKEIIKNRSI